MIGKYEPGYKPTSYHDVREKLLKQVVKKIDDDMQEFRDEWKRTDCSIMPDGWTNKKRKINAALKFKLKKKKEN